MYSKNKSKLLQTLEECVPPLSHEDAIGMIAQMVRQPISNPIEAGLRLGRIEKEHNIMHAESQLKLHAAMESFDGAALDSALPVSDKELTELAEVAAELDDDDDDGADEDDEDDDDDDMDDELEDDDDADDGDNAAALKNERPADPMTLYNLQERIQ
ncbi:PH domain-containing protein YHR131C [Drosophila mojavensis]|uniref:Uncharacterized protein n=1 Tax=Drosophila mojavensis TaxID=7230 RepID=A0A0Q9XGD8_DROMO|nr:PH domain-containing protein YHR131C [Drosophila mojavensis]KRG02696.1 uncharacterized protein Dmoj_GI26145 [Drosophila mojavensis]